MCCCLGEWCVLSHRCTFAYLNRRISTCSNRKVICWTIRLNRMLMVCFWLSLYPSFPLPPSLPLPLSLSNCACQTNGFAAIEMCLRMCRISPIWAPEWTDISVGNFFFTRYTMYTNILWKMKVLGSTILNLVNFYKSSLQLHSAHYILYWKCFFYLLLLLTSNIQ